MEDETTEINRGHILQECVVCIKKFRLTHFEIEEWNQSDL